jgi:hypothetical protein
MRPIVRAFPALVLAIAATATVVAQPPAQGAPVPGTPPAQGAPPPGRGPVAAEPPASPAAVERAVQILAETRKALGGPALDAVTTVVATGRTRRVRGDNLVPIEFEISIQLPDKYARKDESPAEESEPTSTGFNGSDVIQFPIPPARGGGPGAPPPGRPGGPAPTPEQLAAQQAAQRATRLTNIKQEFARLALGMFAKSLETYPMTFAFAAQAQAPQGTADVIEVRGAGNFAARLFIASDTHLPIMLSWQAPPTNVIVTTPGQPPPRTVAPGAVIISAPAAPPQSASAEERENYTKQVAALRQKAQAAPIEYRFYYADYRDVNGVKFPFRLRRAIGTDTTEETTFDRFRLNTQIDPRKFAVPK